MEDSDARDYQEGGGKEKSSSSSSKLKRMQTYFKLPDLNDGDIEILGKARGEASLSTSQTYVGLVMFITMACIYASFIFTRSFFSTVSDAIRDDDDLNMDTSDIANLYVLAGISFGLGKLLTGILVDYFDAKLMLYVFMLMTSGAVILFSFASSYEIMIILVVCNAIPQAGGYPALAKLIYEWFHPSQYGRAFSFISVGSRVGSATTSLLLGAILSRHSWRFTIRITPIFVVIALILSFFTLNAEMVSKNFEQYKDSRQKKIDTKHGDTEGKSWEQIYDTLTRILMNRRFWYVSVASSCLLVSKGFEGFIPLYLSDILGSSSSTGAMFASSIPLGITCSIIAGGYFLDDLRPEMQATIVIIGCGLNALFAGCMLLMTWIFETGSCSSDGLCLAFVYITCFLIGFSSGYAFYIPQSVFAVRFGGEDSATVVGMAELVQAFWSASFVLLAGNVGESYGWRYVWLMVTIIASFGVFFMTKFYHYDLLHEGKEANFFQILGIEDDADDKKDAVELVDDTSKAAE